MINCYLNYLKFHLIVTIFVSHIVRNSVSKLNGGMPTGNRFSRFFPTSHKSYVSQCYE